MTIQLIQGQFNAKDAINIISQIIGIKIKYHENLISNSFNEEDIKFRESRIKLLQKELHDFRNSVNTKSGPVKLDAVLHVE